VESEAVLHCPFDLLIVFEQSGENASKMQIKASERNNFWNRTPPPPPPEVSSRFQCFLLICKLCFGGFINDH
jgi:hypothetical protein